MLISETFAMLLSKWALAMGNAVPCLLLQQPQVSCSTHLCGTWEREHSLESRELICSSGLKEKKKKPVILHMGERRRREGDAWQHCCGSQVEVLNSHSYVVLHPLMLLSALWDFYSPRTLHSSVWYQSRKLCQRIYLKVKGRRRAVFFTFISETEQFIRSTHLMHLVLFLYDSSLALEAITWLIISAVFIRFPFLDINWHFVNYLQWDTAACLTSLLKA